MNVKETFGFSKPIWRIQVAIEKIKTYIPDIEYLKTSVAFVAKSS